MLNKRYCSMKSPPRFKFHSDEQLVELVRKDNRAAFEEIYNRFWMPLYLWSYTICGEKEESRDICQEVFIWLWENRAEVNITKSVKSYLFSAIKYKTSNYIRRGKVKQGYFEKLKNVPVNYDIEDSLELKELQAVIHAFAQQLPERCGEVFKLSRNHCLSNKEIASKLNISERTVENHISIALKRLRRTLSKLSCWFFFL